MTISSLTQPQLRSCFARKFSCTSNRHRCSASVRGQVIVRWPLAPTRLDFLSFSHFFCINSLNNFRKSKLSLRSIRTKKLLAVTLDWVLATPIHQDLGNLGTKVKSAEVQLTRKNMNNFHPNEDLFRIWIVFKSLFKWITFSRSFFNVADSIQRNEEFILFQSDFSYMF